MLSLILTILKNNLDIMMFLFMFCVVRLFCKDTKLIIKNLTKIAIAIAIFNFIISSLK